MEEASKNGSDKIEILKMGPKINLGMLKLKKLKSISC